jgi:Domain of unknown function (DUF4410)
MRTTGKITRNTAAFWCALFALVIPLNAASPPQPYTAVQIDRFVPAAGIAFPFEYRTALVENIAREMSVEFPTVIIVRQDSPAPAGQPLLRVSAVITEFKPGNRAKRVLIGFGAGATVVRALVRFTDASSGQLFLDRELKGTTFMDTSANDAQAAADSLARKIVKLCNTGHLVASQWQ